MSAVTIKNAHTLADMVHRDSNGPIEALHLAIDMLVAAVEGHEVSEWQPIETAPETDVVLLWTPMNIKKLGAALPLTGYQMHGFWVIVNADSAVQRVEPTHWMPLPPPPKEPG
jgi:hypothetical protein